MSPHLRRVVLGGLAVLLCVLALSSCGTYLSQHRYWVGYPPGDPGRILVADTWVYGGALTDLRCAGFILPLLDLPVSFAADTVLLPLTIAQRAEGQPAEADTRWRSEGTEDPAALSGAGSRDPSQEPVESIPVASGCRAHAIAAPDGTTVVASVHGSFCGEQRSRIEVTVLDDETYRVERSYGFDLDERDNARDVFADESRVWWVGESDGRGVLASRGALADKEGWRVDAPGPLAAVVNAPFGTIVAGRVAQEGSRTDLLVMLFDDRGRELWSREIATDGWDSWDETRPAIAFLGEKILVVASSGSPSNVGWRGSLRAVCISRSGRHRWTRSFGAERAEGSAEMASGAAADGRQFYIGSRSPGGVVLRCLSAEGELCWTHPVRFPGDVDENLRVAAADGLVGVAATTLSRVDSISRGALRMFSADGTFHGEWIGPRRSSSTGLSILRKQTILLLGIADLMARWHNSAWTCSFPPCPD